MDCGPTLLVLEEKAFQLRQEGLALDQLKRIMAEELSRLQVEERLILKHTNAAAVRRLSPTNCYQHVTPPGFFLILSSRHPKRGGAVVVMHIEVKRDENAGASC